jgi:hypothetical protein
MPAEVRTILLLVGSLDIPTPNFTETATHFPVWVTSQGQMGRTFARKTGFVRDGGTQRHPPGMGTGIGRGSGVPIDVDPDDQQAATHPVNILGRYASCHDGATAAGRLRAR